MEDLEQATTAAVAAAAESGRGDSFSSSAVGACRKKMPPALRHRQNLTNSSSFNGRPGLEYDDDSESDNSDNNAEVNGDDQSSSSSSGSLEQKGKQQQRSSCRRGKNNKLVACCLAALFIPTGMILVEWTVVGKTGILSKQRLVSSLPPSSYYESMLAVSSKMSKTLSASPSGTNSGSSSSITSSTHVGKIFSVVMPSSVAAAADATTTTMQHSTSRHYIPVTVYPTKSRINRHRSQRKPHFGNIKFRSIKHRTVFRREISEKESVILNAQIKPSHRKYFVDTEERYAHYDEVDYPKDSGCYKPKWAYEVYPSCNMFHELPLERNVDNQENMNVTYLGRGHFRQGWSVLDATDPEDGFVLKTTRLRDDTETIGTTGIAMTQTEAVTMLATAGSSRTTDIYGHCSSSVMVESGTTFRSKVESWKWYDQKQYDEDYPDDVHPMNELTPEQKLAMSLQMAEGLADLHGYKGGVIVNHDISMDQWVVAKDGRIKLNDFNKAHILHWNLEKQEYCKFHSQQELIYYAPEEVKGSMVDESADVNTFGNMMYILLTGLKPYYHKMDEEVAKEAKHNGEQPYIDPRYRSRSFIEGKLVEIMEQTFPRDPTQRISIFDVIQQLRTACKQANVDCTAQITI